MCTKSSSRCVTESVFLFKRWPPLGSTLFPYTTLFRSKTDALIKLGQALVDRYDGQVPGRLEDLVDRKSTRLNSSHLGISYAVFCLKKKKISQLREELIDSWNLLDGYGI